MKKLMLVALGALVVNAARAEVAPQSDFEFSFSGDEATIRKYLGRDGDVEIPSVYVDEDSHETFTVAHIDFAAFERCRTLTSVTIPSTVIDIGYNAFNECTKLASVTMHEGLESIGDNAFDSSALTSVTIPSTVTNIGKAAFAHCEELTSEVTIPAGVKSISKNVFHNSSKLTGVTISEGVESIGKEAFCGCKGLASVTIPSTMKSIGGNAFAALYLSELHIASIESWCGISFEDEGSSPFFGSSSTISRTLYVGGQKTEELVIPEGVTAIPAYAFGRWDMIKTVTIPTSVESIGSGAFHRCKGLTGVTIPSSVKSIDGNAFSRCSCLLGVTIPEGVESIGNEAFYGCEGLASVTIPSSVTNVGTWAFLICTNLTTVTVRATKPPEGGLDMFWDCHADLEILVPKNSVEAYKAADGWKDYEGRIKAMGDEPVIETYIVTFFLQGHGEPVAPMTVESGSTVEKPDDPQAEGYVFGGWFKEPSCENAWNFATDTVTGNVALYAKWAKEFAPEGSEGNPWAAGYNVRAYTNGTALVITGWGAMNDFADAADVPWAGVAGEITAVTVEEGVTKVGKNALAGFKDAVTVNGTPLSVYDMMAGARGLTEPVIPDNMVLVAKEELQAAKAEAVSVVDGVVSLGVTVNTNGNFTAETKDWKPVELTTDNVTVKGGKIVISIPVSDKSGFMILQSGDAKVGD